MLADHRDGLSSSSFLAWSSIAQSVCPQAFSLLVNRYLRPWVRILHSAEEDNLSPFDSNIACLCQTIKINNNKHVCMYVCMCVCVCVCECVWVCVCQYHICICHHHSLWWRTSIFGGKCMCFILIWKIYLLYIVLSYVWVLARIKWCQISVFLFHILRHFLLSYRQRLVTLQPIRQVSVSSHIVPARRHCNQQARRVPHVEHGIDQQRNCPLTLWYT